MLCVLLTLVGVLVFKSAGPLTLSMQAARFALGQTPPSSSLRGLHSVVPQPEGWRLMGVSRSHGRSRATVVGFAAHGGLDDVANTCVEAMEGVGWTLSAVNREVGVLAFHRSTQPRRALVLLRSTGPLMVTIVFQAAE